MPTVRPFRALRYDPEAVGDVALVISPPYDVISPDRHRALLARHPRNVVRLDLPEGQPGEEPEERYRRAARTLAGWRSDGTFHKDPRPSVYAYEQSWEAPGEGERVQRGFFARLRLEPLSGGDVRPHERTLEGPREDRYRLLRATGVNTSPVVGLYAGSRAGPDALLAIAQGPADLDVRDDEGIRHRVWVLPEGDPEGRAAALVAAAEAGPITIADGHHRYETALRYRDERRMSRSCEEDPAFDYLLTLFLDAGQPLTVLPTHRIVRAAAGANGSEPGTSGANGANGLLARARELFDVETGVSRDRMAEAFDHPRAGGRGRFGIWTGGTGGGAGALLVARPQAFAPLLPSAGNAVRGLDVTLLGVALERLLGIDPAAVAAGERIVYTKSADEAIAAVDAGRDGAVVAFLLEPTPVPSILAVAAEGEAMPQKSTYFHPKPASGLLINPHEW